MKQIETAYNEAFFAYQPVFDSRLESWGFELFYRKNENSQAATFSDDFMATLEVLSNLALCCEKNIQNARVIVNFSEQAILEGIPWSLPAKLTVVQLSEPQHCSAELLSALAGLQSQGYQLSVDDFSGREECAKLYGMASLVTIDVQASPGKTMDRFKKLGLESIVLAKKIETQKQFVACQKYGFDLFQGYFFKKPEMRTVRKLSSAENVRFELLEKLNARDVDFDVLAKTIELDASLSVRLLKLLNSPVYGLSKQISSIRQSLIYLGEVELKQWLRIILLTDLKQSNKSIELSRLALLRAKFFENMVSERADESLASTLFMLGLFSLLDVMLDLPMKAILEQLPAIDRDVKAALKAEESPYYPWLKLIRAMEDSNWEKVGAQAASLHLDAEQIMPGYQNALTWSKSVLESI